MMETPVILDYPSSPISSMKQHDPLNMIMWAPFHSLNSFQNQILELPPLIDRKNNTHTNENANNLNVLNISNYNQNLIHNLGLEPIVSPDCGVDYNSTENSMHTFPCRISNSPIQSPNNDDHIDKYEKNRMKRRISKLGNFEIPICEPYRWMIRNFGRLITQKEFNDIYKVLKHDIGIKHAPNRDPNRSQILRFAWMTSVWHLPKVRSIIMKKVTAVMKNKT
ncbi:hypothetical protein TRFO_39907 [Tritrichomonas foetus]|uniref:Uncharacterized protein n=1 Tax=Tritrichomonas foetus TaxID=1144522 RepID=A0A1J4J8A9_9EUKA|nr:hypothetical protein TRFO_39907 [Tritrichomonas foetus]|eukprot:OHS93923.1 hypothetical protein TRFO_39907 [Tritrichomonas foetus]